MIKCSRTLAKQVPTLSLKRKFIICLWGHFCFVKYDIICYTANDLTYSIGVELQCSTNDTGMIPADI